MDKLEWLDVQESDRALVGRFARVGDEEAFCAIVDRHAGMVYATCRRMLGDEAEAADAAQETFLQFSKSAGRIHGSLGSWLHRVATRRAADLIRERASRRRREETYALEAERGAPAWPSVEAAVDEALEELPLGLRELVVMHFLEGQNTTEIAAAKAMSQPTVSRRLAEGLEELRRKLRDHGEEIDAAGLLVLLLQSRRDISKALRASLAKIAPTKPASACAPVAGTTVKLALAAAAVVLAAGAIWFAVNLRAKRKLPSPSPARVAPLSVAPLSAAPAARGFAISATAQARGQLSLSNGVTTAFREESASLRIQEDGASPLVASGALRQGFQMNLRSSPGPGPGLPSQTPANVNQNKTQP